MMLGKTKAYLTYPDKHLFTPPADNEFLLHELDIYARTAAVDYLLLCVIHIAHVTRWQPYNLYELGGWICALQVLHNHS